MLLLVKVVSLIALKLVINSVFYYAVTAPTFVHYAPVSRQEVLSMHRTYIFYVLKFVKHVQLSAPNTLRIMQVAKNVRKFVKNVQKFAKHTLALRHNCLAKKK